MSNNEIRGIILAGAIRERNNVMAETPHGPKVIASYKRAWQEAADGIVQYEPAEWLGRRLTGAERAAFCRELEAMDREGIIEKLDKFGRTTAIRIINLGSEAQAS